MLLDRGPSTGNIEIDPFVNTSTVSYPQNMEQLIVHSISDTSILNRHWITEDLFDELNKLRPDSTTDISPDGNRDAAALAKKCESFFYINRRFCSVRQLEATLQEFSNLWGFTCSRYGMSLCATMHLQGKRKNHSVVQKLQQLIARILNQDQELQLKKRRYNVLSP